MHFAFLDEFKSLHSEIEDARIYIHKIPIPI